MSTKHKHRAAIYLRVSLDATGQGLAVDRQREDCRKIAKERGWKVVDEYVDNSISASDKAKVRPAYERMVGDFERGAFDALVCWDLDRLTRQPRQLEDWIDRAEERGLILVTANGEADLSTDAGRLFARIKASVARAEVERKSARQKRAAQQRAEHGRPPKGVRLTGYGINGEYIAAEAAIVRRIFNAFMKGESLRGIVRMLEDSGVQTRSGRPWNPSSVRSILTNARYTGASVYRGELTGASGKWRPIIDADTFRVVQAKLEDPRRLRHQGTDRKHLGSGLYVCHDCSVPMSSWSGNRYRCPQCGTTRARELIDDAVVTAVLELLRSPAAVTAMQPSNGAELEQLREQVEALHVRLERIGADYDSGLIDGARYRSARGKVEAEMAELTARQAALSGHSATAQVLAARHPGKAFQSASLMVQRAVLSSLLEVRLRRAPRGRKTWDPESIVLTPRAAVV